MVQKIQQIKKDVLCRWRSLKGNVKLVKKGSEKLLFINTIVAALQGIVPFALIWCLKWLIDSFTTMDLTSPDSVRFLITILVVTALIFLLNGVLNTFRNYFFERLSFSVSMHIYEILHGKHTRLDIAYYENSDSQDKIHRAVQEAGFRPVKILTDILQIVRSSFSGLVIIGLLMSIQWYLFLMLLPALIPGIYVRLKQSKALYKLKKANSLKERETFYFNRVLTALPFAKELKLFGFSRFFMNRFKSAHRFIFYQKDRLNRTILKNEIAAQVIAVLVVFGVFGYISHLAIRGEVTVGTLAMTFLVFQRGYNVLNEFSRSATQIVEDNVFLNHFSEFLRFPETDEKLKNSVLEPLKKGIFIENVTFRYKPTHKDVLKHVNLEIPAGETVAFVGHNGSGKTTLIKLLCGFYRPDSGNIYFDNTKCADLKASEIRKQITAVFQDFALYNLSAAENIALGDIERAFNAEKVKEAAKSAGISDIIEEMPEGYENILGNLFTGGKELSIGQWQKFAIARAFYRDSPILIFDEPSSALDSESEKQVLDKLRALSKDRTVIIISHKQSTIKWADRVYVFEDGQVSEAKSEDEVYSIYGKEPD